MREKEERDAPHGAAMRLTEYEPERKDGYVNRLNKETTSFYFTNFPDDVQVMELWKLFAKYGRVGEVYIPKKLDIRGNKFGFVKFKEVKGVEALSSRLEDVWIGSYKLRINLSIFGRNGSSAPMAQGNRRDTSEGSGKKALSGQKAQSDKSFRVALVGESSVTVPVSNKSEGVAEEIPVLNVEVEEEFLQTLIGSYVGRLKEGVELRAIQMKL
ncbi:endonuclease/exonuclease/phosphatase family protein, partial [Trifolium medium]|nr:endonuclease/exonuclease/phosphatase family protein [Trifolium medium]